MSTELDQHYEIALKEVSPITPWWSEDDQMWAYEHPLYGLMCYMDNTPEATIEGYKRVLKDAINDRLNGKFSATLEKTWHGRGGKREGAGRPQGTKKAPTRVIRLPEDVAIWISDNFNLADVRKLMQQSA